MIAVRMRRTSGFARGGFALAGSTGAKRELDHRVELRVGMPAPVQADRSHCRDCRWHERAQRRIGRRESPAEQGDAEFLVARFTK